MVLLSQYYDDIYFSKNDGLAETRHVFINGNNIPNAWKNRDNFTVFETGFGTGLNFLVTWDLFEKTATAHQSLNFISVEKHPLDNKTIRGTLSSFSFNDKIERMLDNDLPQNISLTVYNDDVNNIIPTLTHSVDCWFLDGFSPAKNPDMWTDTIYQNMARMSNSGTTLATYTAAGHVRRGLQSAGFSVSKVKGYGHKREMIVGAMP